MGNFGTTAAATKPPDPRGTGQGSAVGAGRRFGPDGVNATSPSGVDKAGATRGRRVLGGETEPLGGSPPIMTG